MIGKSIRLERIIDRSTHRTIVVPMDHGVTVGPIHGLVDYPRTVDEVAEGGANAVLMHKGLVRAGHRGGGRDIGLIIHASASTKLGPDPNAKVHVCTVEEAMKLGADAVSVHVNLGAATEPRMLEGLGRLSESCLDWGMPLLAMMYCRGPNVENEYDPNRVAQAARVGAELGADIVKVNYTGSPESFREVVSGCPVPVIIAGGEKVGSDEDVLAVVAGALEAGGAGVSIGRNVFQHENPRRMVRAIASLVHGGHPLDEARAILRGKA